MVLPALFRVGERQEILRELSLPLELDRLLPGDGAWEVELGFGKGRFLLERAAAHPERRFLGVEIASKYFRLAAERAARRGLGNVAVVRGEALYLLATVLPRGFAAALHVYFPDPWPKSRHHRRRLFDAETVDLVLGLLAAGGELCFATDFLEYGEAVATLLAGHPDLEVTRRDVPWPDGARTNYEAKYLREGRPILRLSSRAKRVIEGPEGLHPAGRYGILVAPRAGEPIPTGGETAGGPSA